MFYYSIRFKASFLKFVLTQVSTLISKIFISVHRGSVRSRSGSTFVQREGASAEHSFVRRERFRCSELGGFAASSYKKIETTLIADNSDSMTVYWHLTCLYTFFVTLISRNWIGQM